MQTSAGPSGTVPQSILSPGQGWHRRANAQKSSGLPLSGGVVPLVFLPVPRNVCTYGVPMHGGPPPRSAGRPDVRQNGGAITSGVNKNRQHADETTARVGQVAWLDPPFHASGSIAVCVCRSRREDGDIGGARVAAEAAIAIAPASAAARMELAYVLFLGGDPAAAAVQFAAAAYAAGEGTQAAHDARMNLGRALQFSRGA